MTIISTHENIRKNLYKNRIGNNSVKKIVVPIQKDNAFKIKFRPIHILQLDAGICI